MGIKALDWAMDAPVNDPLAKLVLLVVANHHNDARGVAWPSVRHIAEVTGASERTVQNKLRKLEETGFLVRNHRNGRSTEYTPAYAAPPQEMHPTPAAGAPITNKEPLNKKRAKIKVCDWEPDGADIAYARSKGADWKDVLQSIRLWSKQNGDKASYVDMSAFWQNWIRRDQSRSRPKQTVANNLDNRESSRNNVIDRWDSLTSSMQERYMRDRPDVVAELKKMGKV